MLLSWFFEHGSIDRAKKYADSPYTAPEIKIALDKAITLVEQCQWPKSYAYSDSMLSSMKKAFWQASSTKYADIAGLIVKPELLAFAVMSPVVFFIIYVGVMMNGFWRMVPRSKEN